MTPSEEIKNKLDIVEVVREYIQVKAAGRNFQALCPFHNEKTPSFTISPEKQIWHCFGCDRGGDIFTFVMEKENLTFPEALRLLAGKAGVVLEEYKSELATQKNRLLDCLEAAATFYQRALNDSPTAEAARQYLSERGLTEEVIEDWQIGYSPDSWDDLLIFLKSKGFNERDILAAGLAVQKAENNRYFNRFRGRIMFPLHDVNANLVGFTARVLPANEGKDGLGKYVNSPQSQLFDKSKLFFGLHRAKTAIREQEYAVIVEGQMDVITAHQFGFKNVIAASGTALTAEQIKLLERFTDNVIFALDADSAGQSATARGSELMTALDVRTVTAEDRFGHLKNYTDPSKSYKKNIRVAVLPAGKDPDNCIRQDRAGWIRSLQQAKPLMQYYFDRALAGLDLSMIEDRRRAGLTLLPLLAQLPGAVEQDYWLKKLADLLETDLRILREDMAKLSPTRTAQAVSEQPLAVAAKAAGREEILSEHLLALTLKFSGGLGYLLNYTIPEYVVGAANQMIYKDLILYYNQFSGYQDGGGAVFVLNYSDFRNWLEQNEPAGVRSLDKLAILAEKEFYSYDDIAAGVEIKKISRNLKRGYLVNRRKEITKLIAEAESQTAAPERQQELDDLLREFNNLTQELSKILDLD